LNFVIVKVEKLGQIVKKLKAKQFPDHILHFIELKLYLAVLITI